MVDLQTVIEELRKEKIVLHKKVNDSCTTEGEIIILLERLADLEKNDTVEVTRCERCVYWNKYENSAGAGRCMCQAFAFEYGQMGYTFHPITIPRFHCGYGIERKTANEQERNN